MSARRALRSSGGPGWLSGLVGAAALVSGGFAFGLVAGLAFEDPDLLAGHVIGQTQSLDLAALGELGDEPAVPEPPPLGAREGSQAGRTAERVAPPLPPVAAPAPVAGRVAVQVGAFEERATADRLRQRVRGLGLPSYLEAAGDRWRVRAGPFANEAEARRAATRLEADALPTWIVRSED